MTLRPTTTKGGWFDIERFVRTVQGLGISVDMVHRDNFLRSMLFDAHADRSPRQGDPKRRWAPTHQL